MIYVGINIIKRYLEVKAFLGSKGHDPRGDYDPTLNVSKGIVNLKLIMVGSNYIKLIYKHTVIIRLVNSAVLS